MSEPKSMTTNEMLAAAFLLDRIIWSVNSTTTKSKDTEDAIRNYNQFLLAVEKRQQIHEFKQGLDPYGPINEARKSFEG